MSFSQQQKAGDQIIEKTNDLLKQGLRDLNQANQISDETQKKLYEQNGKLDRTIENIDKSQQSINNSQYITRGLKSFFGQIVNMFTSSQKIEKEADQEKTDQTQQQTNNYDTSSKQKQQKSQSSKSPVEQQNDLIDEMNNMSDLLLQQQLVIQDELKKSEQKLKIIDKKQNKFENCVEKLKNDLGKI